VSKKGPDSAPFWQRKTLAEMTKAEWESLCDGCGKCCLHKIREDDNSVKLTNVACRLLNTQSCRCTNYPARKRLVPDCIVLKPKDLSEIDWLPKTCAYRLVADGKDLPDWHPLVSGDPETVHSARISVSGRCISERDAGPLRKHIVRWRNF
jgi:uncharacterized cysteine cluster protein YcgN (CxxCxxCC family)